MKKTLSLVLALVLLLGMFTGCGKTEEAPAAPEAPAKETAAAAEAAPEAAYEYQKVTLGWGTTSAEGTVVVNAMNEFAAKIAEATNGNVKVDIYPGSVLGNVAAMLEQCQLGTLAMTNTQPANIGAIGVPELYVLSMPYLFSSFDARWDVLYGEIGKELNDLVTEKAPGIVGFSYYADGARHFFTNFPVNSLADMKGRKIRVQSTALDTAMGEALGVIPTPTSSSEMYQAMSTGLVEGAEQPIANYYANKYTEVSDYLILDAHTYNTIQIIFSENIWNTLDPQLQTLLTETWDEIIASYKDVIIQAEEDTKVLITEAGVEISEVADIADWAAAMDPVYETFSAEYGEGFVSYLERVKATQ